MKYHTLLFSKICEDVAKLSSAAVVIDALTVKIFLFLAMAARFWWPFCLVRRSHLSNFGRELYEEQKHKTHTNRIDIFLFAFTLISLGHYKLH